MSSALDSNGGENDYGEFSGAGAILELLNGC